MANPTRHTQDTKPAGADAQGSTAGVAVVRGPPHLRQATDGDRAKDQDSAALRRFHLTGECGLEGGDLAAVDDEILPALLSAYGDPERVRTDYPLCLSVDPASRRLETQPLHDQLGAWVESFAPQEGQARILRDNLPRIERLIRDALAGRNEPAGAAELIERAAATMKDQLALAKEPASTLAREVAALVAAVPADATLLGFSDDAALHLLLATARATLPGRRAAFRDRVFALRGRLDKLLKVEANKSSSARSALALRRSLGSTSGGSIDADALAAIIGPHRGSTTSSPERLERIESARALLDVYLERGQAQPLLTIIHGGQLSSAFVDNPEVDEISHRDPCVAAAAQFDRVSSEMARVFRALRTASLELAGDYDSELHGPWLESFDWETFSAEELHLIRPVVALTRSDHLSNQGLPGLSQLLLSTRPVKVLVTVDPGGEVDAGGRPSKLGSCVRFELGYFAISHREAMVHQGTAARPGHLVEGFAASLAATCPSLHALASTRCLGEKAPRLGGWLHGSAAIESRAFPLFHHHPELGQAWAHRFDFAGNPEPEASWASSPFTYRDDGGERTLGLSFTFADFALLEPALREHFRVVPEGHDPADFVSVDAYLELDAEAAMLALPFVWAVDKDNHLRRVLITRQLAFACRDRANYWRTLQELAGVKNEYVRQAVAQAQAQAKAEAEAELAALNEAHASEVEAVRMQAAGESMERLAAMLLETDFSAPRPAAVAGARSAPRTNEAPAAKAELAPAAKAELAPAEPAPAAPAEDEDLAFDDPWIDTPLCTSCNDCLGVNPLLFVYDGNKQAQIGDAAKGTFEELVRAAEACPAKCIHPGKPKNPAEPGLEELLRRAAPFN